MRNYRKYLIGVFLLLLVFVVISCTKEINSIDYSGESIISITELKKLKNPFKVSEDNIEEYLDKNQTGEKMITLLKGLKMEGEYNPDKELSMKDLREDLDNYFNYLKGSYAGYLANGGDYRFLKAKQNVIFNAYLYNSNILFGFGNFWRSSHPDYFQEFKGFQPDIWVEEVDVEELVKILLY